MMRRHPPAEQLRRWLDTRTVDDMPEVSAHVESCSRCALRIEALAVEESAPGVAGDGSVPNGGGIAAALISLLEPADGLVDRIEHGVADRLGSRQLVLVLADLLGAGVETSKLLLTEEDL